LQNETQNFQDLTLEGDFPGRKGEACQSSPNPLLWRGFSHPLGQLYLKKVTRKSDTFIKKNEVSMTEDFSLKTIQPRRKWNDTFQVLKENNYQDRIL
jgi:hypothetical protein